MATQTSTGSKVFSIANFRKAFSESRARQYMSDMEIEQIRTAIEEKDIMLLGKLYDVLLQEQLTDEQIIRDFVMTKNKLLDGFMVNAMSIEKTLVQGPMKKRVAKAEKKEQKKAEDILNKL
jgi:hypothetical protein